MLSPRMPDPILRLATPFPEFGYARGFFKKDAQLFRPGFYQSGYYALFNNRITTRANAGSEENILDILTSATGTVQIIGGNCIPVQQPFYGNLGIAGIGPA